MAGNSNSVAHSRIASPTGHFLGGFPNCLSFGCFRRAHKIRLSSRGSHSSCLHAFLIGCSSIGRRFKVWSIRRKWTLSRLGSAATSYATFVEVPADFSHGILLGRMCCLSNGEQHGYPITVFRAGARSDAVGLQNGEHVHRFAHSRSDRILLPWAGTIALTPKEILPTRHRVQPAG